VIERDRNRKRSVYGCELLYTTIDTRLRNSILYIYIYIWAGISQ